MLKLQINVASDFSLTDGILSSQADISKAWKNLILVFLSYFCTKKKFACPVFGKNIISRLQDNFYFKIRVELMFQINLHVYSKFIKPFAFDYLAVQQYEFYFILYFISLGINETVAL